MLNKYKIVFGRYVLFNMYVYQIEKFKGVYLIERFNR